MSTILAHIVSNMPLQKYERDGVKYVLVEFFKPFIKYPQRRKPSLQEQWADEDKGYLTPFKTVWMKNGAEGAQEQPCASIVTSFKPKYQRGKFSIPQDVSVERHARDVRAQLLTLQPDWIERGFDIDMSAA
jgi:hypothetical protein